MCMCVCIVRVRVRVRPCLRVSIGHNAYDEQAVDNDGHDEDYMVMITVMMKNNKGHKALFPLRLS